MRPAAVRYDGYLKALYRRHVMKWGGYRSPLAKNKAIIVVAHAILVIIWHALATGKPYGDRGADYLTAARTPAAKPAASSPSSKPSATTSPSRIPPPDLTATPEAGDKPRRLLPPARLGTIHASARPLLALRLRALDFLNELGDSEQQTVALGETVMADCGKLLGPDQTLTP